MYQKYKLAKPGNLLERRAPSENRGELDREVLLLVLEGFIFRRVQTAHSFISTS
jgi:hypothetical protein